MSKNLLKTCSHCGLQKPLSAFLQFTANQGGTVYGKICASCRKIATQAAHDKESGDTTKQKTGHRLDYKMKLADGIDKKQRWKEIEELYYKEREQDEDKQIKKDETKETKTKDEKKHRQEKEKKTLSNSSIFDKRTLDQQSSIPEQVMGGQIQLATETKIDVTAAVDTQKAKYGSASFKFLQEWLGETGLMTPEEKASRMRKRADTQKKETVKPEKEETLPETVNRLWPGGRKK